VSNKGEFIKVNSYCSVHVPRTDKRTLRVGEKCKNAFNFGQHVVQWV
jgi:hypothetical protein